MKIHHVKRAFTLIELLVVIAIIAILAAILFPTFAQAKVTAKQVACMSNMRQVSFALRMYTDDHDDRWPGAAAYWNMGTQFAPQQMWIGYDNNNYGIDGGFYGHVYEPAKHPIRPGLIDPYLKSDQVKKCPSQPQDWQLSIAMNFFSALYWSPYYNTNPLASGNEYGPGTFDCNFKNNVFNCIGAPGSMMDESTNTLIGWEHLSRVPVCNFLQVHDWYENPPNNAALEEHFHFLHRNGANTMWGDGHSKHITYGKMKRRFFSLRKDIYPN